MNTIWKRIPRGSLHLGIAASALLLALGVSAPTQAVPPGPPSETPVGPPDGLPPGPPSETPVGPPGGQPPGPPGGQPPGPPGGQPPGGDSNGGQCQLDDGKDNCRSMKVKATGSAKADIANIQQGIRRLNPNGELQLWGVFNLRSCIGCLRIDKPISITGRRNPNSSQGPADQITILEDGVVPFVVNQSRSNRGNEIAFRNLWLRGQILTPAVTVQTLDKLVFEDNRITETNPLFLLVQQFRFSFAMAPPSTLGFPNLGGYEVPANVEVPDGGAIPDGIVIPDEDIGPEAFAAALFEQYPELEAALGSGESLITTGDLVIRNNYVNQVDTPGKIPFIAGDDNAVGVAICSFNNALVDNNFFYTRGEMELEGCFGKDARFVVTNNEIHVDAPLSFENTILIGAPDIGIKFGHPAAIKVIGNEAGYVQVTGNRVTVSGSPGAVAISAGTTNPDTINIYENNRIEMIPGLGGVQKRVAFAGGYPGIIPFFPVSFLENASIKGNTFVGSALYAMAFVDMRWLIANLRQENPQRNLTNKANRNIITGNDFSGFNSGVASVRFGPSTFQNTFEGNPNGNVIDDSDGANTVIITP